MPAIVRNNNRNVFGFSEATAAAGSHVRKNEFPSAVLEAAIKTATDFRSPVDSGRYVHLNE
jgi:hypothetical protein